MPKNSPLLARIIALAIAVSAAGVLLAQPGNVDAPLFIQRIVLPPDKLAKELEKLQQGALISLPWEELEARLARVGESTNARQNKPRLTRALYRAELIDHALTNGQGQWSVEGRRAGPAILPLDALSLALRKVRWEHGDDAVLGEFDGKSLGLFVAKTGMHECSFEWSARGTATSEGLFFSLAIPPCPITIFELTLPPEYWLTAAKGNVLVTGPQPASPSPRNRLWRVQVTSQDQVELSLRRIVESQGPAPTLFARVQSLQNLAPDRVQLDQEFQIDVLHGSLRELTLEGNGPFEPYDVSLKSGEIKAWQWRPLPAKKDGKLKLPDSPRGLLAIQFHHPVQGKIQGLRVRSLGPAPTGKIWVSPSLRVRDAVSRGETLKLQIHPAVRAGNWDLGTYQLTQGTAAVDGAQALTLVDAAPDSPVARRPMLVFAAHEFSLHTREQYQWRVGLRSATLHADIEYLPAAGRLTELLLKLPKSFPLHQFEAVEIEPREILHRYQMRGDYLVLELREPLSAGKGARVMLRLRAEYPEIGAAGRVFTFPAVELGDSAKRAIAVHFEIEPSLQAQLLGSSVPPSIGNPSASAADAEASTFVFGLRDQRLDASIRVTPRPTLVRWRGKHNIQLADQTAKMQFHWDVQPLAGMPRYLDLRFAPGFPGDWKWKADEGSLKIHHWEHVRALEVLPHLLLLGARTPAQYALLDGMMPAGSYWRFHLSEPLERETSFVIEATVPAAQRRKDSDVRQWSIPLMAPVQGRFAEQTIRLDAPAETIEFASAKGPIAIEGIAKSASHLQALQISPMNSAVAPSLTLRTRSAGHTAAKREFCDQATVTTFVYRDQHLTDRIRFRLWNGPDRQFNLRLHGEAKVLAVRVNDFWLDRLDVAQIGGGVRLTLPVPTHSDDARYEILVQRQAQSSWLPGTVKIAPLEVEWPAPPADLRQRWALESGLTPLHFGSIAPVGVPDALVDQTSTARWLQWLWSWNESGLRWGAPSATRDRLEGQKQLVLACEAQLRADPGRFACLGEALEKLATDHLKDSVPLVIDAIACCQLGLTPATPLPPRRTANQPFWDALGLIYVPCPAGALLTSAERMESLGILNAAQTVDLDAVIREAVLYGRDASEGFAFILTWLDANGSNGPAPASAAESSTWTPVVDFVHWHEWQPLPGFASRRGFYLVDTAIACVMGWTVALFTAVVCWHLLRRLAAGTAFRVSLLSLTACFVAALYLPATLRELAALPMLGVQVVAFAASMVRLLRKADRRPARGDSTIARPVVAAVLVGVVSGGFLLSASAQSQGPRSYPVLIVDGAKPMALVTPELLAKLDDIERQSPFGSQGVVLVSAKYVGQLKDASGRFDATCEIYAFKDEATVVLPLSGVQLFEGTTLDGNPAYPTVHKNGYALTIAKKGRHQLRLTFGVRVAAAGDHADLRFGIPRLAQSELSLQLPASWPAGQCLHCCGEERVSTRPEGGLEWSAQIGGENSIHFRWPTAAAGPSAKVIEVKEAHCWDLRPASFSLASSFQYALGNGNLNQLIVAVPEGLQVRSVEASVAGSGTGASAPLLIKNWQYVGKQGQRRLQVDLAQPAAGSAVLNLEFVAPALVKTPKLSLPLPAAIQGKSVAGALAYRIDAADVRATVQNLVVQDVPPETFAQIWNKQWPTRVNPAELRAFSFQRKAQQAGLELVVPPQRGQAQMQLVWRVDYPFAELHVKANIASARDDLSLLEFSIDPALTLASVIGADVARWHVDDALLQIWLRQPCKQTAVELIGWRLSGFKGPPPAKRQFSTASIFPLRTKLAAASLQIDPAPGIRLEPESMRGLRPDPTGSHRWTIDDAKFEATFALISEPMIPSAAAYTTLRKTETGIDFACEIRLATNRGKLPAIPLELRGALAGPLDIDAPAGAILPSGKIGSPANACLIKYPPGLPGEIGICLRGRLPLPVSGPVAVPVPVLRGIPIRDHWYAWEGIDLVDTRIGRKIVNDPQANEAVLRHLPRPFVGGSTRWKFARAEQGVALKLPKASLPTNLQIIADSSNARLTDAGAWQETASFWLRAPESAELRLRMPDGVRHLGVFLDQAALAGWSRVGDELVIPVDADAMPRRLDVRMLWDATPHAPARPALLRVLNAAAPPNELAVTVPRGIGGDMLPPAPGFILRRLHKAERLMPLSAAFADATGEARKPLLELQRRFCLCLRQAEFAAALLRDIDAAPLQNRIVEIQRSNAALARERQYTSEQRLAERTIASSSLAALPGERRPADGLEVFVSEPGALALHLEAAPDLAARRARVEIILLLVVSCLLLSYFRAGLFVLRVLAPEWIAAAALLSIWFAGAGAVAALLVAAMIGVRLVWTVRTIRLRRQLVTTDFEMTSHPSGKNRSSQS